MEVAVGQARNISIGGMFIETETTRPQGTLVRFELLIDETTSVRGLGEVVWMRAQASGTGREAGIGIKFRFLEQRDRQLIFKLVSQHIKNRLSQKHPPVEGAGAEGTGALAESPLIPPDPATDDSGAYGSLLPSIASPGDEESVLEDAEDLLPDVNGLDERHELDERAEALLSSSDDLLSSVDAPVEEIAAQTSTLYVGGDHDLHPLRRRPKPRRDFPTMPVIAVLLVSIAAGVFLLRGDLFSPPPPPPLEPPPGRTSRPAARPTPAEDSSAVTGNGSSAESPSAEPATPPPSAAVESPPISTRPLPPRLDPPPSTHTAPPPPPAPPSLPRETRPPPERPPSDTFTRVVDITWTERIGGALAVIITADGPIPKDRIRNFRLDGPREVVQLKGVRERYSEAEMVVGSPKVRRIRTGYHKKSGGNELHIVIDVADLGARMKIDHLGSELVLTFQ